MNSSEEQMYQQCFSQPVPQTSAHNRTFLLSSCRDLRLGPLAPFAVRESIFRDGKIFPVWSHDWLFLWHQYWKWSFRGTRRQLTYFVALRLWGNPMTAGCMVFIFIIHPLCSGLMFCSDLKKKNIPAFFFTAPHCRQGADNSYVAKIGIELIEGWCCWEKYILNLTLTFGGRLFSCNVSSRCSVCSLHCLRAPKLFDNQILRRPTLKTCFIAFNT